MEREVSHSLNDRIALIADADASEGKLWPFLCECDADDCVALADLELPAFRALRAAPAGRVLVDGHFARARETRARAEELRGEATALEAQARHQAARARRNLRIATRWERLARDDHATED